MGTLKLNTISNLAGTKTVPSETAIAGSAKAWVNFNGTGTVAIRDSFNVTSITDNGTGDYTVNFTTAMANTNYCFQGTAGQGGTGYSFVSAEYAGTVSAKRFLVITHAGAANDATEVHLAIFSN
jgi:hypothetical protein